MTYVASELLTESALRHGIRLDLLVAETGLWASPEVHRRLAASANGPAFFPNRRRYRAGQGEQRGQRLGDVVLDHNSYANVAIKRAIGVPRADVKGFEACHIWPLTCYDERCHTVIANLVLLPRALAGLTDHSPEIQRALQFRSWELYGWCPEGKPQPTKPSGYPTTWREPMPFNGLAASALAKRLGTPQGGLVTTTAGTLGMPSTRDYTRFDIRLPRGHIKRHLPKRLAMLVLVRALVASDVLPAQITSALPELSGRLFRSAPGHLDSQSFVATVRAERARAGKTFDASRYLCADGELL